MVLQDAHAAFCEALKLDPGNQAAKVGQAECDDRLRIYQQYAEQMSQRSN